MMGFNYKLPVLTCHGIFLMTGFNYRRGSTRGGLAQWLASRTMDQGVPGSRPGCGTVCCGLEQVTFTHRLVLVKPKRPWTDNSD